MRKKIVCRSLCLLLCLLLCACSGAESASAHGRTPFTQMTLSGVGQEGIPRQLEALEAYISSGGEKELAFQRYEALLKAYETLKEEETLLYIRRCRNMEDAAAAAAYGAMADDSSRAGALLTELEQQLMERWPEAFDPAYIQKVQSTDRLWSRKTQFLLEKEHRLCEAYEKLRTELTVEYQGRSWSYRQLREAENITFREFFAVLELYESAFYSRAGEIYLQLLALRKEQAKLLGFPSYAHWAYTRYKREYSPEQALELNQAVKECFGPLYKTYRRQLDEEMEHLGSGVFDRDTALKEIRQALDKTGVSQAGEAWDYMLTYELLDDAPSPHKLQGSFTAYLQGYECPYLFTQWESRAASISTLLHEFGHFLAYYVNPQATYYEGGGLDLAEVDSQGMELLLFDQYEALFGSYAEPARSRALLDGLYAVLAGFMEDEFQQRALEMEAPTVEKLNNLYLRLAGEYGLIEVFRYSGREWMDVSHTFSFPFYYVSYGVSMLGALSLWQKEQRRPGSGWRAYEKLLHRRGTWDFSYVMGRCGTGDILSPKGIETVAAGVEAYLKACVFRQAA
mgnify:FL=1